MTSFQDAPDEAMEMTKQWRLVLAQFLKYTVLFLFGKRERTQQHTNKYLRFMQLIFLRNQLSSHTSLSLSLSLFLNSNIQP